MAIMSYVQKKYDPMAFIPDPEPVEPIVEQPSANLTRDSAVSNKSVCVATLPKQMQSKVTVPNTVPKVTVPLLVR